MTLVCFCHLRWNFVYQRPQHLMTRFAKVYDVYYIEECVFNEDQDGYTLEISEENVRIITPHLKIKGSDEVSSRLQHVLDTLVKNFEITPDIFWYYTPMALKWTYHYNPSLIIYDCMDELSAFKFAPPELKTLETMLMMKSDLVFTGGYHLYEAKKHLHPNIFPFPSSIDKQHFGMARLVHGEEPDQKDIPNPRFGFFGVIDERFDIGLISRVARMKPEWHFIFIGPVVKIDPASLPRQKNIHYLGPRSYSELPAYLAGWDIALIPFAINESTEFISPTKTPEYLAAGKPVISSPIADVVSPYGESALVHIVNNAEEFIEKATEELARNDRTDWLNRVDQFLKHVSWDKTWDEMHQMVEKLWEQQHLNPAKNEVYV